MTDLKSLLEGLREKGCTRAYFKWMAPNDNSKNQIYLAGDFELLQKLPMGAVHVDESHRAGSAGRPRFKANLEFSWLTATGSLSPAPHAKLILYPDYPEVRLSGFLRGSPSAPNELFRGRGAPGRLLVLGATRDARIIGFAAHGEAPVSRELAANFGVSPGVLRSLPLEAGAHDGRDRLIAEFRRIHLAGWLTSRRFDAAGQIIPCTAQNCGGYTLEVELGVRPSGKAEPDFLGWEVKQFTVPSFERPSGVLTLMTPEPDGGTYKSKGAGAFVRRFGYADKSGEPDRLNFGGIHRVGVVTGITGLRLEVRGYDRSRSKISDVCGGVCLVAKSGEVAASWSFSKLIEHWKVKHAQTVFAMSQRDGKPTVRYRYGPRIYLGKGADFVTVLDAFASGQIYYDPALKLEKASTKQAALKRRSQFRIRFSDVSGLYRQYEAVELV